jgi:hypothetical protein
MMRFYMAVGFAIVVAGLVFAQKKQERDFIPKAQEEVAFSIYEQFMDGKLDRENWYWQRRSGKSIDALSLKPKEDIFTQNVEFWFVKA